MYSLIFPPTKCQINSVLSCDEGGKACGKILGKISCKVADESDNTKDERAVTGWYPLPSGQSAEERL